MKLRKIAILVFALIVVIASCTPDDDSVTTTPPRDRTEVYAEDLAEIETFLETHFYNYEDFDFTNPYSAANDDFEIVFEAISPDNLDKTPIMDRPELKFKMVVDEYEEDLIYKMYYLEVRQGAGEDVHFIDEAFVTYEGLTTDGNVFDNAVNSTNFELTSVLNGGVVTGFREALIEFKTATNFDAMDVDGTVSYKNHGIGAAFIPSGIGYFSLVQEEFTSYTPLIFKFNVLDRVLLDHDNDGIPSFLEDLDNDLDVFDDDTNEDDAPNFFDNDDDGDGYNTSDEIELKSYPEIGMSDFTTRAEAQAYYDDNAATDEILSSIDYSNTNETYTLNTFIATDSNGNGTPDYLDVTYPEE